MTVQDWTLLAPAAVLGIALVVAGYPLFRVLLVAAGAWFGFLYGPELLPMFGILPQPVHSWLLAGGTALLLALVAWQLFGMAVFFWGFLTGYGLGFALIDNVFIAVGSGVVLGLLALAFRRTGVIVMTSAVGAWLLTDLVLALAGPGPRLPPGSVAAAPWPYLSMLAAALLGIFLQLRLWPARREF